MNAPYVSVILPTYNRAALLSRAIGSVLGQTYTDLELIVVDDGSTDNTDEVLRRIGDSRLRVIRQQLNSGPGAARNTGIRAAVGRYVAFQDSDAEWLPEKLQKQIELLEAGVQKAEPPAACYSRIILSRRQKRFVTPSDPETALTGSIYQRLLYGNTVDTSALLVRKDVLDSVGGFDESLPNREDWELALRIANNCTLAFLDEVTLISYDTPNSVNKRVAPESEISILNKNLNAYMALPPAMARITWSIGSEYAMRRHRADALHYMRLSLEHGPTLSRRLEFAALRCGVNLPFAKLQARKLLQG